MAQGGGGSWKVAYADFVTAMMAFFLVMWIGAQDQKIRQSVANYFVDPSGVNKKPVENNAVLDSMVSGSVPKQKSVDMGRGRQSHDLPGEPSTPSQTIHNWIRNDAKRLKHWQDQARHCRQEAAREDENPNVNPEEIATRKLAELLRRDIAGGVPPQVGGLYQDLLYGSFTNDVNWTQLAQDILSRD